MNKVVKKLIGLKRYFALTMGSKQVAKADLLSSNEALKALGKVGIHHRAELMMMMAVVEYEYGRNNTYTNKEIGIVQKILADVYGYFIECGQEWEAYERSQADKK